MATRTIETGGRALIKRGCVEQLGEHRLAEYIRDRRVRPAIEPDEPLVQHSDPRGSMSLRSAALTVAAAQLEPRRLAPSVSY